MIFALGSIHTLSVRRHQVVKDTITVFDQCGFNYQVPALLYQTNYGYTLPRKIDCKVIDDSNPDFPKFIQTQKSILHNCYKKGNLKYAWFDIVDKKDIGDSVSYSVRDQFGLTHEFKTEESYDYKVGDEIQLKPARIIDEGENAYLEFENSSEISLDNFQIFEHNNLNKSIGPKIYKENDNPYDISDNRKTTEQRRTVFTNSELLTDEENDFMRKLAHMPESDTVEYKKSIVYDSRNGGADYQMDVILEAICAFLNAQGGQLFIGVDEKKKKISGIEMDFKDINTSIRDRRMYKQTFDHYLLKITHAIDQYLTQGASKYIKYHLHKCVVPKWDDQYKKDPIVHVLEIIIEPSPKPISCLDKNEFNEVINSRMYRRRNGNCQRLHDEEITDFILKRKRDYIKAVGLWKGLFI